MPTNAGTSKPPIARMKTNSARASSDGIANGNEIRRSVSKTDAPLIRAASSMSAFAARNVEPSSRNTSGDQRNPSIRIIPDMEFTLNRTPVSPVICRQRSFNGPTLPRRNSQAITCRTYGVPIEMIATRYASTFNGAFVRSTSHARTPPVSSDSTVLPAANSRLFHRLINARFSITSFWKCRERQPGDIAERVSRGHAVLEQHPQRRHHQRHQNSPDAKRDDDSRIGLGELQRNRSLYVAVHSGD